MKRSLRLLVKLKKKWPVPKSKLDDPLGDCLEIIKRDAVNFFPKYLSKVQHKSIVNQNIRNYCDSTWDYRAVICHSKKILAVESERKKIEKHFEKFQSLLNTEILSLTTIL